MSVLGLCRHCGSHLSPDEGGHYRHVCPDNHLEDRFVPLDGKEREFPNEVTFVFTCGCSISVGGKWKQDQRRVDWWACVPSDAPAWSQACPLRKHARGVVAYVIPYAAMYLPVPEDERLLDMVESL